MDQVRVVTVSIPATAPPFNVDFTDPAITEPFSAAVFIFTRETTDGSDQNGGVIGVGFVSAERGAGASGEQSACFFAEQGQTTTPNTGLRHSTNRSISVVDTTGTGTLTVGAVFGSSIAGGVRMSVTTRTITCKVTAILFAGLSRAAADSVSSNTVSATEPVGDTGIGTFSPDLVLFCASDSTIGADFSANGVGAHPNLGFAIKATLAQSLAYVSADDTTEPSDADGYLKSAAAWGHLSSLRAIETVAISAFPATGFTHVASAGTVNAHYLALKFSGNVRLAVANFAVAASTGPQAFNSFGFTPDLVFGMGTLLTAVDAALEDGAKASCSSYFVTGRYGSRALTWHTEEGATVAVPTPANSHTRQEDVAVLQYNHTGTIVQRATWGNASGSGGFILDFSVASAAGFLTALGIQFVPNPPLPGRRVRRPRRVRSRRIRRAPLVLGRVVGQPPLLRGFWKAIARMRRAALRRLRSRPFVSTMPHPAGTQRDEPPKGRISQSGLVRGRIVSSATHNPEEL